MKIKEEPLSLNATSLNEFYFKYNCSIYYKNRDYHRLNEADLKSFKIISDEFAKDKNYVYRHGIKIKKADINSFKVLNWPFSKDKNNVYERSNIIKGADPQTFVVINDRKAKDKNREYDFFRY